MTTDQAAAQAPPGTSAPAEPAGSGPTAAPAAAPAPSAVDEPRRDTRTLRRTDWLALTGAAAASVSLTALLFSQVAPFSGPVGFVVVCYLLFLGLYALLVSFDENGLQVRDRVALAVVHGLALVLVAALVLVVGYTLWKGRSALRHLNLFTQDITRAGPLEPLTVGGILHGAVGSLEQIGIALAITIPLGLTCAVFLTEIPGPLARFVRTIADAMTALPSIVAGLFIYATLILILGFNKSGFAAALAISVMMLPIIIRASDVVLRLVPGSLQEASLALGASRWRTVWHVSLPTARSGLATAIILGTARGIGETSPVLLTAGYTATLNADPLHGPQVSLPLLTFTLVRSGQPGYIARGFGAGAVLMLLVLVLFVLARLIGGRGAGQLSRRQQRRRAAASRRDVRRYAETGAAAAGIEPPAPGRPDSSVHSGGMS
ncbi:MAG TPA: phosphate ABC transporter permease PstA [Mycobacteriales bacterium]|nr:phosphate ABC transporter permease PstA [Mycobacteriales bacterium]